MGSTFTTPRGFRGALPPDKVQLCLTAPAHYAQVRAYSGGGLRCCFHIAWVGCKKSKILLGCETLHSAHLAAGPPPSLHGAKAALW